MMEMDGKVCIITGASSGIGEAIAVLFAEKGASLVLCGRSSSRLQSTVQKCEKVSTNLNGTKPRRFVTVLGDLTESDVRKTICEKTLREFGCIDVLIANAGILGNPMSLEELTEENYDVVMATDVKAVLFLVQQALPALEKSQGSVVCLSSTASTISGQSLVYHMAKAGVDHMCRCLAASLGPKGIRVNSVNPTFVQTRLLRSIMPELEKSDEQTTDPFTESKKAVHPLHGRVAEAKEVAEAVMFLASERASFITGQNVFVDGGISRTSLAF